MEETEDCNYEMEKLYELMEFQWRVQSYSRFKAQATCIAYIDARQVMDKLDEIIGPDNWQSDYKEIKGNLYAGIGIRFKHGWIWKWDCGIESKESAQKGEASDAFKRAAVKWGIFRFGYELPMEYIQANGKKGDKDDKGKDIYLYPVDENGKKIYDVTKYISNLQKPEKKTPVIQQAINEVQDCTTIDQLRLVRNKYEGLEKQDKEYKKSLAKKYELLNV